VAVNGQPAAGIYVGRPVALSLTPTAKPRQAIADSAHASLRSHTFEILKIDGTPVGTIMSFGLDAGPPPPGALSYAVDTRGDYTIFGGTGAFLGARGELVQRWQGLETVPPRAASMAEDPANRRINGGGRILFFLHVIPMDRPQFANTPQGPAVTHASDFTVVSASKPAVAGEILSLFRDWPWPDCSGSRSRPTFSLKSSRGGQLAGRSDGERETFRSYGRSRLPRHSGRLSSELSRTCGHGQRNREPPSELGVDHRRACEHHNPMMRCLSRRSPRMPSMSSPMFIAVTHPLMSDFA
jgi:hypothetical protein